MPILSAARDRRPYVVTSAERRLGERSPPTFPVTQRDVWLANSRPGSRAEHSPGPAARNRRQASRGPVANSSGARPGRRSAITSGRNTARKGRAAEPGRPLASRDACNPAPWCEPRRRPRSAYPHPRRGGPTRYGLTFGPAARSASGGRAPLAGLEPWARQLARHGSRSPVCCRGGGGVSAGRVGLQGGCGERVERADGLGEGEDLAVHQALVELVQVEQLRLLRVPGL